MKKSSIERGLNLTGFVLNFKYVVKNLESIEVLLFIRHNHEPFWNALNNLQDFVASD